MKEIEFKNTDEIKLKKFLLGKNISNRAYKKIIKDSIFVNDKKVVTNIDLHPKDSNFI